MAISLLYVLLLLLLGIINDDTSVDLSPDRLFDLNPLFNAPEKFNNFVLLLFTKVMGLPMHQTSRSLASAILDIVYDI
jgi:hypothetical protein